MYQATKSWAVPIPLFKELIRLQFPLAGMRQLQARVPFFYRSSTQYTATKLFRSIPFSSVLDDGSRKWFLISGFLFSGITQF